MIEHTLEKLGLRDEESKAFLFLLEHGEQTAGNLAKKTGISRPSLYGFLTKLQNMGLVIQSQKNGIKTFHASSQEKVLLVLHERISELEKGKRDIEKVFSEIKSGALGRTPKFQLFEGREGVRGILKDALLYQHIDTISYWPIKTMIEILGEKFFRQFNKDRIKRNIYTRAIWPEHQRIDVKKHPYLGVGEDFLREIRIAPKAIDFEMGYWMYEDKVAFISSSKESFGFIVESEELVKMLTSQFEVIWKLSKPLHMPKEYTQEFVEEMKSEQRAKK